MNQYDLASNSSYQTVLAPAAVGATTTNTDEIDRVTTNGFEANTFVLGQASAGLAVGTVKLQHSDTTGTGFVDCASDDVIGTQDQAFAAGENSKLGYVGYKQFVRMVVTTTTGGDVYAVVVKSSPKNAPVA